MQEKVSELFDIFFSDAQNNIMSTHDLIRRIVISVIVVILWILIKKSSLKIAKLFSEQPKTINRISIIFSAQITIIAVISLFWLWFNMLDALIIILILIAVISVISLRKLTDNIVGWFILMQKKVFKLHDYIEVDEIIGEVVHISPFHFKLMELTEARIPTGRLITVPNSVIVEGTIYNFSSYSNINWEEIKVYLTVKSNFEKAFLLCEKIAEEYTNEFNERVFGALDEAAVEHLKQKLKIVRPKLAAETNIEVGDKGIALILEYPIIYDELMETRTALTRKLLATLSNEVDVEIAGRTHIVIGEK